MDIEYIIHSQTEIGVAKGKLDRRERLYKRVSVNYCNNVLGYYRIISHFGRKNKGGLVANNIQWSRKCGMKQKQA